MSGDPKLAPGGRGHKIYPENGFGQDHGDAAASMERVTYHLERSLPALAQLAENGVFSRAELQALTATRQQHEARVIRRVALWSDFEAYIEWEHRMERLRVLRCRTMGE